MFESDFDDPFEDLTPEETDDKLLREYFLPALRIHCDSRKQYEAFIKENGLEFFDKPRYRNCA